MEEALEEVRGFSQVVAAVLAVPEQIMLQAVGLRVLLWMLILLQGSMALAAAVVMVRARLMGVLPEGWVLLPLST